VIQRYKKFCKELAFFPSIVKIPPKIYKISRNSHIIPKIFVNLQVKIMVDLVFNRKIVCVMKTINESDNITNENVSDEILKPVNPETVAVETQSEEPVEADKDGGADETSVVAEVEAPEKTDEAEEIAVADKPEEPEESEVEEAVDPKEADTTEETEEVKAEEPEYPTESEESEEAEEPEEAEESEESKEPSEKRLVMPITNELRERNLQIKKDILAKLKELVESNDDFYKIYNEYRKLQQKWKEAKHIPQEAANALWKEYQMFSEKFYDLLKINNEMRDYDFRKNLELKQGLCDAVERLDSEKDVVSAFYQLQKLHLEWREIGPVARNMREEIWTRFKKASAIINKKYQKHFESLRSMEHRNLADKTAICEEIEAIDFSKLTNFKEWDEQLKKILELQEKWKTIGFAPKKHNTKIFERFRKACDAFFKNKTDFYKGLKNVLEENLARKRELCEQAEALKDSREWKETTDKLVALQKEWKTIGPVPRKHSNPIWKRFIQSCDYFFEQKAASTSPQKAEEAENLTKKQEIIEKLKAIDTELPAHEAFNLIKEYASEWNKIGYVPIKEKEKINKEYHAAMDAHFDRLKIDESERRLQSFKSNIGDAASSGGKNRNKLLNEREKLMRTYERLKNDIQTYENNIGFLTASSKGGSGLIDDMNKKIDGLKDELNLILKKIEVIDESFEDQD
jgi:hypothetical protein